MVCCCSLQIPDENWYDLREWCFRSSLVKIFAKMIYYCENSSARIAETKKPRGYQQQYQDTANNFYKRKSKQCDAVNN
jgi:hypothetical protein